MNLETTLFYILAVLILGATTLAVTRRNLVYAVIYLVLSFFGTAMLFYLLGAPFLAAMEIIIYAGAIMVLFLFIIMMIYMEKDPDRFFFWHQSLPALFISFLFLGAFLLLVQTDPGATQPLITAATQPKTFGLYLFKTHWLAIEIASLLLLVALVGVLALGRRIRRRPTKQQQEQTG